MKSLKAGCYFKNIFANNKFHQVKYKLIKKLKINRSGAKKFKTTIDKNNANKNFKMLSADSRM